MAAPQSSTRKDLFTENDPNTIRQGISGTGIWSGCAPSPGAGLKVAVASGVVYLAGVKTTYAGGDATIDAEADNDRRDLVTINSGGSLAVVKGTAGTSTSDTTFQKYIPYPPTLPSGSILIEVYIADGVTSFAASDILDKRVLLDTKLVRTSEKIVLTSGMDLEIYAPDGVTLVVKIDADGNISYKGNLQQL